MKRDPNLVRYILKRIETDTPRELWFLPNRASAELLGDHIAQTIMAEKLTLTGDQKQEALAVCISEYISFHLNQMITDGLIKEQDGGHVLTDLGHELLAENNYVAF